MNGIMNIMDNLLNQNLNTSQKKSDSVDSQVNFGQFFKQWQKGGAGDKPALSKEEQKLLEKSLEHLMNFKLALGQASKSTDLKKALEKMEKDTEFMNALSDQLKTLLQKTLRQLQEGSSADKMSTIRKELDSLLKKWEAHKEKKRQNMLGETDDLIAAIQARLAAVGITAQAQVTEKDGGKAIQVTFHSEKAGKDTNANMTSKALKTAAAGNRAAADIEGADGGRVVSKALLNRISNFLAGADGTVEKSDLNKQTFELRDDLKKYLKRDIQPASWMKDQIVHKAQQNTSFDSSQIKLEKAMVQEMATAPTDQLLKEQTQKESITKEQILKTQLKEEAKSSTTQKVAQPSDDKAAQKDSRQQTNDPFAKMLTNAEQISRDIKGNSAEAPKEAYAPAYVPDPADIFQQMVDKFRVDIKQGVTQMEIKLYPEDLGSMHLKLTVEKGIVSAHILTENAKVKELIEENLAQLKNTFAQDGVTWDKITVDVNQDSLRENPFAYQQQSNMQEDRRGNSNRHQNFRDSISKELAVDEVEATEDAEGTPKDSDRIIDYLA